jgi:hypothetical protein
MQSLKNSLFILGLSLGVCACTHSYRYEKKSTDTLIPLSPEEKVDEVTDQMTDLAAPGPNGISQNTFSVSLKQGVNNKRILIPFHYRTDGFSKMTVDTPTLSVSGCSGAAEVGKLDVIPGQEKDAIPAFFWSAGWVEASAAKVLVGYGVEEDIQKPQETLVLMLVVPADCDGVSGQFDVRFR